MSWPGIAVRRTASLRSPMPRPSTSSLTSKTWMPGIKPGMTAVLLARSFSSRRQRRDRDEDGADLVAAVDDLAALVRADVAAIVLAQHGLLAADDHGELAFEHVIDLLGRRGVRASAAAGQEMRDAGDDGLGAA